MKKPLLVVHLFFAGLISVGLTNDTASHNQLPANTNSPAPTASHNYAERGNLQKESHPEAMSNTASSLSDSFSTTAETSVWGGDSCRPVPVEVKPCQ